MSDRTPITLTWSGYPMLRCPICGRDFIDDGKSDAGAEYAAHMAMRHALPRPRRNAAVPTPAPEPVVLTADDELPVWFRERVTKAEADGVTIPPLLAGETQKAYDARVAAQNEMES